MKNRHKIISKLPFRSFRLYAIHTSLSPRLATDSCIWGKQINFLTSYLWKSQGFRYKANQWLEARTPKTEPFIVHRTRFFAPGLDGDTLENHSVRAAKPRNGRHTDPGNAPVLQFIVPEFDHLRERLTASLKPRKRAQFSGVIPRILVATPAPGAPETPKTHPIVRDDPRIFRRFYRDVLSNPAV